MICILKTHWVLGGAERYLADLSAALTYAGNPVMLASLAELPRPPVHKDLLSRSRAVEMQHWPLRRRALEERSREFAIFINAIPSLVLRPAARENWLVVFSPGGTPPHRLRELVRWHGGRGIRRVLDASSRLGVDADKRGRFAWHPYRAPRYAMMPYRHIIAISEFVAAGIRTYWGCESELLYPAVDLPVGTDDDRRKMLILSIGRFLPSGNQKHHSTLIEAFRQLHHVDDRWRLVLIGGFEDSLAERVYLEQLTSFSTGLPIDFLPNAPERQVSALLGEASFLWHAAGARSSAGDYLNVEQFGMAVAEAAAHGVVPLVFPAGGVPEILPRSDDFTWENPGQLADRTLRIANTPGRWQSMSQAARTSSERFARERFRQRVGELLGSSEGSPDHRPGANADGVASIPPRSGSRVTDE